MFYYIHAIDHKTPKYCIRIFVCYGNIFPPLGKLVTISWDFTETLGEATAGAGSLRGSICSKCSIHTTDQLVTLLMSLSSLLYWLSQAVANHRFSQCKLLHEMFILSVSRYYHTEINFKNNT